MTELEIGIVFSFEVIGSDTIMKLTNTIEAHRHKYAVIIFHTSIDKFVFNLYTILRKARI